MTTENTDMETAAAEMIECLEKALRLRNRYMQEGDLLQTQIDRTEAAYADYVNYVNTSMKQAVDKFKQAGGTSPTDAWVNPVNSLTPQTKH